jgi:neutral amino acid transport system permease protein
MDWGTILSLSLTAMVGSTTIIYALAALGLNIQFGYTGLLNFGQAGFAAIGAYGVAVITATLGQSLWLSIVVGLIGAVVFALILGIPTLRLRADYLAIVTIAAAEVIRQTARSVSLNKYFGGSDGITGKYAKQFYDFNPFDQAISWGPISFNTAQASWVVVVGWVLVGLVVLLTWLLVRSPWGRVVKSIREDEDAARSLGKNVYLYKMQALILGGLIGSLAGIYWAIDAQSVQPDNYGSRFTFFAYTILILGGAARVFGPVVGSLIFWFILVFIGEALTQLVATGAIPTFILRSDQVGQIRFMLVGLALMLLIVYRPQGIFGDKRELTLDGR